VDVTVCIGTYGGTEWVELAQRAIASARAEGVPVIHVHGETLASARNGALQDVATEWVVVLDADDELEPGYFNALEAGSADVRAPAVRYVSEAGTQREPYVPRVAGHRHACTADCLPSGNWLVIGSAMRTAGARDVGGFHEWPVYEDWDLFLRLHRAGSTFEALPDAVYRAHVRPGSRNRAPSMAAKNRTHHAIVAANALPEAA
jgi:glycosyltransferase involved in cell wall biosynthesis